MTKTKNKTKDSHKAENRLFASKIGGNSVLFTLPPVLPRIVGTFEAEVQLPFWFRGKRFLLLAALKCPLVAPVDSPLSYSMKQMIQWMPRQSLRKCLVMRNS